MYKKIKKMHSISAQNLVLENKKIYAQYILRTAIVFTWYVLDAYSIAWA